MSEQTQVRAMTPELSVYLHSVRFVAAVAVVFFHANIRLFVTEPIPYADFYFAHSAVIAFFVLSGFVIAFVVEERDGDVRGYVTSRAARIYSVVLPAIVLAMLCDRVGSALDPALYVDRTTPDLVSLRIASSLLFLNETWDQSIMSFSNVAYWSLNYEVWYYVMFGLVAFLPSPRRWWALAAVVVMIGPKIVLLAPLWWLGVWLFRSPALRRCGEATGWILWTVSFLGGALLYVTDAVEFIEGVTVDLLGRRAFEQLVFSRHFLLDYVIGVIVALNIVGFRAVSHRFTHPSAIVRRPITWLASLSFSIYLLHQPLLLFFAACLDGDRDSGWFVTWILVSTFATCMMIGVVIEAQKGWFRGLVARTVDIGAARLSVLPVRRGRGR